MGILNIAPVALEGMRFLALFHGLPGSGKTLSALRLAAGVESDPMKRALLDTEGGQRGRMYANYIDGGYLYGNLKAPFTPERYREAYEEFLAAGVTTLVIDSASHVWNAEGGVIEMAEQSTLKNDMARWKAPKRRLAKFISGTLQGDIHTILCCRSKRVYDEVPNPASPGKTMYVPGDIVPVAEKNLHFDMMIIAHMLQDGQYNVNPIPGKPAYLGKCPAMLRPIFEKYPLITEDTGRDLVAWLGTIRHMTPAQRALSDLATAEAGLGTEDFRKWWAGRSKEDRLFLRSHLANLESAARAADRDNEVRKSEEADRDAVDAISEKAMPSGIGMVSSVDRE